MAPRKPPQALVNSAAMSRSASSSSASAKLASTSKSAIAQLWSNYQDGTSARLKLIDTFLLFLMLTGVSCFAYCVLITDFPFNAFLAAYVAIQRRIAPEEFGQLMCHINRDIASLPV